MAELIFQEHNLFQSDASQCFHLSQVNITDIVNKSSVRFFITKLAKKISVTCKGSSSCCSRQNNYMTC